MLRTMWLSAVAEPLGERPFRRQFLAQAASVFGDNVAPVALAFAVLDLTGSATDLGIVLLAKTVPFAVLLLVAGVWADRLPRHRVMVASDLGRLVTQGAVAALLVSGHAALWELVVLQALNGAATAFFMPAAAGLTPQTVSAARLQQANALLSLTMSTSAILGPALAGVLVTTVGSGWALAVDAASFGVSGLLLAGLRFRGEMGHAERQTFLADLAAGWREVRSRAWVWTSIVNFALFQLFVLGTFQVLGPVVAKRSLGGASAWALITAAAGIGSLAGDVAGLRLRPRRLLFAAFAALLLSVPLLILLGLATPLPITVAGAVLYGIAYGFPNILWLTALQENAPPRAISRLSSYDWMGSIVLRPIGYGLAGPVAAAVGLAPAFFGAGAAYAAAGLLTLSSRSVRTLERRRGAAAPFTREVAAE
jgi:predicted MFS family arabinose efflux permease